MNQEQELATNASAVRAPRFELFALLGAYLAVRLPFIFTVPMQDAPDEFAHYWVIKFLVENHRLPGAAEVLAGGPSAVYGSLPQLGYVAHFFSAALLPVDILPLTERFGSLIMGAVLLWTAVLLGRALFPAIRLLQLALPIAVIFHPQLAFVHSYANNDSTSSALSAVLLLLAVRSINDGITIKRCTIIGALTGWLALSKYSGLAMMPVIAAALIAAAALNSTPLIVALSAFSLAVAVSLIVSGWWFYRNVHEFSGDLLGTQTMYKTWAVTFNRDLNYHIPIEHVIKSLRWWRMMFFSFWGMFGYMNRYLWRPVYIIYLTYLIAAVAGFIAAIPQAVRMVNNRTAGFDLEQKKTIAIWSSMTAIVLVNLAAMVWASTTNLGGPQGRYLFTSELPVLALLLAGMHRLGGRYSTHVVVSFLVFNAFVCLGSWIMLFNVHGFRISPL